MSEDAVETKEPEAAVEGALELTSEKGEATEDPKPSAMTVEITADAKIEDIVLPESKVAEVEPSLEESVIEEVKVVEAEPTETPEEKAKREREALDASTSYIDSVDTSVIALKDEDHPQLQRPGVKPSARRGRTKQAKTFAELEEDERKRQEEAAKPHEIDQTFEDSLGLLDAMKKTQRGVSVAQEAQNVHASFMQKAKERREKEEAERKTKEALMIQEEAAQRMSTGGRPKSTGGRPKSIGRGPVAKNAGAAAEKVEIDIGGEASEQGVAKVGIVDKVKRKLEAQGCCAIS